MKGNMSKVVDVICNFQITTNMVLDILKPKPNMCGEELEQVRKQFDIAKYEPLNMQDLQSLDAPWYVVRYALLADEPLQRQHQGASSCSVSPQKPVLDSASSFASVQNAQGVSPSQTSLDHVQTPQPTPAITIIPSPAQLEQSSVNVVNFNNNNVTSASSSGTVAQAHQTPLVQEQQVVATSNNNIAERRSTHVKYLNLKARVLKAILAKNKQIYIVKNKKSYSSRKSSTPGHHHHNHHHSTSNNNHHSNNNAADAGIASSSINRRTSNGADLK